MYKLVKFPMQLLAPFLLIFLLSGCLKDPFSGEEVGAFSLSLSADEVVVESTTKSADNVDLSSFQIDITTLNGENLKTWASYSEMPGVVKFAKGNYWIKAHSGDSTRADFDAASYSGSSKLSVYTSEQQQVSILCKLNKMLVSVQLEESMKEYYTDLSTDVTVGKAKLTYSKDEVRKGYFPAGKLNAKLHLTRKDGSLFDATVPEIPTPKAGEHYILTFQTKSGIGSVNVVIKEASTNDVVIEKEIPTEATTNLPPYFVASSGFTMESPIVSIIETGTADVRMLIKARGYIKNCIIGVKSAYLISKGVPREFNLASTSYNAELAAILKNVGMVWSNDMNSSTIAEIDFSGMLAHLPAGEEKGLEHTLTLKVEDNYQRTSDPLTLRLFISSPLMEIVNVESAKEENGKAVVKLNCTIENGSFDHLNRVEILDGFTWKTLPAEQYTLRISPMQNENATLTVNGLDVSSGQFSFRLVHKNPGIGIERTSEPMTAYLVTPKILIDVIDTFIEDGNTRVRTQNKARFNIRIEADPSFKFDPNKLQLKVRNQGVWENIGQIISSNAGNKTAVMEVTGLTPSEKYRIRCIYDGRYNSYNEGIFQTDGFHFETWGTTQTFSNVLYGGRIGWKKANRPGGWGKLTRSEGYNDYERTTISADNINDSFWATNGAKTVKSDFNQYNTWYLVPSILKTEGYKGGTGLSLRSVAWDNRGLPVADGDISKISDPQDPGSSLFGVSNTNWNTREQVPPTDLTNAFKASGKLFLGSYNCVHDANGKAPIETYNEPGLKLRTKPVGIRFYYKFVSCNGDSGSARAEVYDDEHNLIGSGELTISSDTPQWTEGTVLITYTNQAKASYIRVVFASSAADKFAAAPTAEMQSKIKLISDHITTRNATGNVLSIDEVELKY